MDNKVSEHFEEYICIFRLVKSAINNVECDISDLKINWKYVYSFAYDMSFISLVKLGIDLLKSEEKPPKEIMEIFQNEFRRQVITDTNQLYELELLQSYFEKAKIDMLLLKGTYFKRMYPDSVYRYMGDIDTYVDLSNFERAENVLKNLNYISAGEMGGHDKIYEKEPYICLEQHFSLYEGNNKEIKEYYNGVSERWNLKNGYTHIYEMTIEDIYIFLTVHAIQHFNYAGIPPRIFLDYYVFLEKYDKIMDKNYVSEILSKFGYSDFEDNAKKIAYRWFGKEGEGINKNSKLDLFLISGSTYGKMEHNIGIRTSKMTKDGKKPSRLKFLLKQIFPSYGFMKSQNEILRKYPVLLPIVWVIYVIKRALNTDTIHYYNNVNKDTSEYYKDIIREIGLSNQKD